MFLKIYRFVLAGSEKSTCDFERKTLNFVLNPAFLNQSVAGVARKKSSRCQNFNNLL